MFCLGLDWVVYGRSRQVSHMLVIAAVNRTYPQECRVVADGSGLTFQYSVCDVVDWRDASIYLVPLELHIGHCRVFCGLYQWSFEVDDACNHELGRFDQWRMLSALHHASGCTDLLLRDFVQSRWWTGE